ncbi:MAG: arginine--tRNA ligase, partial [Muribaculaceae bacterium]
MSDTLDAIITKGVSHAVKALYELEVSPESIVPQATRKEFEGNMTIVVFPWVKAARKAPEAVANEIGQWLVDNEPIVEKYNTVKGFLNLVIRSTHWNSVLQTIASTPAYGVKAADEHSPLVMVEYSSPNTNKPLHLGHVRNNLLGYSLSKILAACGNKVIKTNIVNDRGIHICKSMLAWEKWANGATPESTGIKGDHLIGDCYVAFDKHYKAEVKELMSQGMTQEEAEAASPLMQEAREMLRKWEQKDPHVRSLWQMMNEWVYAGFDETYKRLGVSFDKIYYESDTYLEGKAKVLEGLDKGIMYRKDDGSVWADLSGDGLDQKLLLRSDGTSV